MINICAILDAKTFWTFFGQYFWLALDLLWIGWDLRNVRILHLWFPPDPSHLSARGPTLQGNKVVPGSGSVLPSGTLAETVTETQSVGVLSTEAGASIIMHYITSEYKYSVNWRGEAESINATLYSRVV